MSSTSKTLLIIVASLFWVFVLPGFIAYKNGVFTGKNFVYRVSDSTIKQNLAEQRGFEKFFKDGHIFTPKSSKIFKVSFSGFIDNQLNNIWFTTFVFLGIFIFIIYQKYLKFISYKRFFILLLLNYILFAGPNWYRNSIMGRQGRTIYSYVNIDIDPASFWLQELRIITFSCLLAILFIISEKLSQEKFKVRPDKSLSESIVELSEFSICLRKVFLSWQRNILIITAIFLPWTWFYWRNISFYLDFRYVLAAIIFHSFWIISICLYTLPLVKMRFEWWEVKTKLITILINSQQLSNVETLSNLEPYPKSQFFVSTLTTATSIILPLVQLFFK